MTNHKPKYIILYKTEEWKLDFFKKRLLRYADILDYEKDGLYSFKYFDVLFVEGLDEKCFDCITFGIIIEEELAPDYEIINNIMKPSIENPFIGGIHVMK